MRLGELCITVAVSQDHFMKTISLTATFDGQKIRLDEHIALKPNTRLLVTVFRDRTSDEDHRDSPDLALTPCSRR